MVAFLLAVEGDFLFELGGSGEVGVVLEGPALLEVNLCINEYFLQGFSKQFGQFAFPALGESEVGLLYFLVPVFQHVINLLFLELAQVHVVGFLVTAHPDCS